MLDTEINNLITQMESLKAQLLKKAAKLDETIASLKEGMRDEDEQPAAARPQNNGNGVVKTNHVAQRDLKVKPKAYAERNRTTEQFVDIIQRQNKFLRRKEIEDIAAKEGRPFNTTLIKTISAAKKSPNSKLGMIRISPNHSVWGLKEWVDGNGKIKPGFEDKFQEKEMPLFKRQNSE